MFSYECTLHLLILEIKIKRMLNMCSVNESEKWKDETGRKRNAIEAT